MALRAAIPCATRLIEARLQAKSRPLFSFPAGIVMKHMVLLFWTICAACELGLTSAAYGHGFAGARFFPATLSTDDPFVADELSLPTVSTIRTPDNGGTRETDISVNFAKRITPQFAIEIGETLTVLNSDEGPAGRARERTCLFGALRSAD